MNITRTIFMKSLVAPFYKQNAGLFAFLIFMMMGVVGRANGVGLLEYHLSLIQGIMTNSGFLIFTLAAWLLYGMKCVQYVMDSLAKKENMFLSIYSLQKPVDVYVVLILVLVFLLLPVLMYAGISVGIGLIHHWWSHIPVILSFFFLMIVVASGWFYFLLSRPDRERTYQKIKFFPAVRLHAYFLFLLQYVGNSRKLLFLVIKMVSCGVLYGLLHQQTGNDFGMQMTTLFFSFCLLGHGVLIYLIREMEENELTFYRGLPISLGDRFGQYALFYMLLFAPETIVIARLTGGPLPLSEAILFIFYGISMLLFLNSLLFIRFFSRLDYLKIVTGLFFFIFIAVLTGFSMVLFTILLLLSVYIFFRYYYQFEKLSV